MRGDKSGFILRVDAGGAPKTLGRRLSFKKDTPERHWFVLDGLRLTWFDTVDGKELGAVHMNQVEYVDAEDAVVESTSIVIHMNDKTTMNLVARSNRPAVSHSAYCKGWVTALRKAKAQVAGQFGSSTNTGMIF